MNPTPRQQAHQPMQPYAVRISRKGEPSRSFVGIFRSSFDAVCAGLSVAGDGPVRMSVRRVGAA